MKYILALLLALVLFNRSIAQLSPFDGSYLIPIKLVDKNGNMLKSTKTKFYLQEVDNKLADSCTSNPGMVKNKVITTESYINEIKLKWKVNDYSEELIDKLTKANVFINSNMFVSLNQSEHTCTLIGKSETVYTNYIYLKRRFVITYMLNNKIINVKVPNTAIYSLSNGSNDLKKFKPFVIKLQ
ncbi:MAG: hypothetical protein ACOVMI_05025 [Chitinophagaceae bacterium]